MSVETNIEQKSFEAGKVSLISTAHGVHDTYTAYLPALLPLLIEKFALTNTAGGFLSVFMQIPSLFQPVIGHIADRKNLRILAILAPTVTAVAMSFLGLMPAYGFLIPLLIIAGISSASLHAVSPGIGSSFSGKELGKGMSFWMVGGELGRVFGPIVLVTAVEYLTLGKLPWLILVGFATSVFLYTKLKNVSTQSEISVDHTQWKPALSKMRRVMVPVAILIFTRSLMTASLTTYLPTFLTSQGANLWVAGASLTILQAAGVIGAFLAGPLSDHFGRRIILLISYITVPIFMFLFINTRSFFQIPLLILLGFFAISVVPVIMAVVIENAPENRSFANGIYMALSFIINALSILLVGIFADLVDFRFTFIISAAVLPLGLPFIFMLPKRNQKIKYHDPIIY